MNAAAANPSQGVQVLVTGGGGFLGRAIVEQLLARGDQVRTLARGAYPELATMGVDVRRGDIRDADAVASACDRCDVVYHAAAKAGVWGSLESYLGANLVGTENVIAACRNAGVRRLVYTSSPSVVFSGADMAGVDESVPYPARYHSAYSESKGRSERAVLAAADDQLRTAALRPHLIWGPRDNHIVPRLVTKAAAGKLRRIGRGNPMIDTTYIDDAARAHLLAADALAANPAVSGRAYFISQGDPRGVWDIINGIVQAAGLPPVTRSVPRGVALAAATIVEFLYRGLRVKREPPMTRFVVKELTTAHWFDISAAKRDLGYEPIVSIEEGLERLARWFEQTGGTGS